MKRLAAIFVDHPAAAHRMLADAIEEVRTTRRSSPERRQRAIAQDANLEPLSEAEYCDMVARHGICAELPGSWPKQHERGATAWETASALHLRATDIQDQPVRGADGRR